MLSSPDEAATDTADRATPAQQPDLMGNVVPTGMSRSQPVTTKPTELDSPFIVAEEPQPWAPASGEAGVDLGAVIFRSAVLVGWLWVGVAEVLLSSA